MIENVSLVGRNFRRLYRVDTVISRSYMAPLKGRRRKEIQHKGIERKNAEYRYRKSNIILTSNTLHEKEEEKKKILLE
jgi:hypothetical protein